MASTYVNDLRLNEMATGDASGTWGTNTNTNLELIAEAFSYGSEAIADASTHTITIADGSTDEARSFYLKCTGGGQACTVTLAPNTVSKVWIVENATSYTLTFSQGSSGANVAVSAGQVKMIATDGGGASAGIVYDLLTDVDLAGTTTAATLTASGTITAATLTASGVITGSTVEATGDTSAGDNAAMGYTAAEGLILTGQGSTSDITLKNDADATVFTVPTGTDDILFPDNAKAMFGAGSDFQIYHDGSNTYLKDAGTGGTIFLSNSYSFRNAADDEQIILATQDGAVTLYHNGTAKLATTSTGVEIADSGNTGIAVTSTSGIGSIEVGSAASNAAFIDLKTPSSDDYDVRLSSSGGGAGGSLSIAGGTFSMLGSGETMATFADDGAVTLFYDNASKLATVTGGVNITGTLTATTEVTVSSDARFKSNIETIDSALNKVKAMRGVYFDKHGAEDRRSVGVIAQEMQEVMPEVVVTDDTEDKHLSVAYGNLVGVLIEAVKELSEEVNELKNNVQTVKFEDS